MTALTHEADPSAVSLPVSTPSAVHISDFTATRNACKLCTPLGACMVFRGIEGCVPLLHGSQGCSTYIRRYMISHYREPVDIASSNFAEATAVFGGGSNLHTALGNVIRQYQPKLIGVATTCLSETIGDDVAGHLDQFRQKHPSAVMVPLVHVSTASYRGTHVEGFHAAVRAVVEQLALTASAETSGKSRSNQAARGNAAEDRGGRGAKAGGVNVLPGMVSPADLRYLREVTESFGLHPIILPDYSDTLDGGTWDEFQRIPAGGTRLSDIRSMGRSVGTIEFGSTLEVKNSAGGVLAQRDRVPLISLPMPLGVRASDRWMASLEMLSGRSCPKNLQAERARLMDALVDGHKHVAGARAILFGDQDWVAGLAALCGEIGVLPILCASGQRNGRFESAVHDAVGPAMAGRIRVIEGMDHMEIDELAHDLKPDLLIGSSKGQALGRKLDIPLIRVGFPIHDRLGGARLLHLGHRGTMQLFDRIANALIEDRQRKNPVGYSYM